MWFQADNLRWGLRQSAIEKEIDDAQPCHVCVRAFSEINSNFRNKVEMVFPVCVQCFQATVK